MPYFLEMLDGSPALANIRSHAEIVSDTWRRRAMIDATRHYQAEALVGHKETQALLSEAAQRFADIATANASTSVQLLGELVGESYKRVAAAASSGASMLGRPTGFDRYDRMTSGLHDGEITIIAARPGIGKAQPLDAKILTPNGWTTMGALAVGDHVIGEDGKPHRVTGVFE